MKVIEIRTKLSSNNINILKQSLSFVTWMLSVERLRSSRAETRATSILAVAGILASFVIYFSKLIGPPGQSNWLVLFIYIISILFLLKSALFAIKALWVLKGCELKPDLAFDLQQLSKVDALREEITWKIWEYYELLEIRIERLFFVNRAQRNIFAAIVTFAFLGASRFSLEQIPIQVPKCVFIFLIVLLLLALFSDVVLERFGKKWHFGL